MADEGRAVYVIYLSFSKPSDIISHNTVMDKPMVTGYIKLTVRWT